VELHVSDRGIGFPPPFLPRAFERFSRGDGSRGTAGSGLGLAIVAAVAHAHGGIATASNLPDGGVDVVLELRHAARNLPYVGAAGVVLSP